MEWIKIILQIMSLLVTIIAIWVAKKALETNQNALKTSQKALETSQKAVETSLEILKANQDTLRANHDWNRRYFAAQLMEKWNPNTLHHRQTIEKAFPKIYDINDKGSPKVYIDRSRAIEVYTCSPDHPDWKLRFSLHELLNFLEYISVSRSQEIADHKIIEDSFKNILIKWHKVLNPFIEVVEEKWGFNPWQPYSDLITSWSPQTKQYQRKKTA